MNKLTLISSRLIVVAVLHVPLAFFLFECWHSPHPVGFAFPTRDVFSFAVASVIAAVLIVPIFRRGDAVQRVVAAALLVFPVFCFAVALRLAMRLF